MKSLPLKLTDLWTFTLQSFFNIGALCSKTLTVDKNLSCLKFI